MFLRATYVRLELTLHDKTRLLIDSLHGRPVVLRDLAAKFTSLLRHHLGD